MRTTMRCLTGCLAAVLMLLGRAEAQQHPATGAGPVQVRMKNILYHYTDDIAVHIRSLDGELRPTGASPIPIFDDKSSFRLAIRSGEIAMDPASLSNVLNQRAFARDDSPLKNVKVEIAGNGLRITGKFHSKGDIPFEMEGTPSATEDGRIRVHATKIKAAHLPVKGLMDLLGIELSGLIRANKVRGVAAEGDDILLDPTQILPPPAIEGRVSEVQVRGNAIVQVFGRPAALRDDVAGNYMAYRGNQLRFGKLTMSDTDMVLIDLDPKDPFDFYLDHYRDQLVAGYTKETPSFGLRVYMRDFNKLRRNAKSPADTARARRRASH